jgi:hypothetical protein
MRRLYLFAIVLVFVLGCATDGDKAQWNEVLKDWNGDNMKMRNDFPAQGSRSAQSGN